MASPAPERMTIEAFLAWDDGTDRRYELVDGRIVAMAPPLEAHGTIVGNAIIAIGPKLTPPCRIVTEAGIVLADRDDVYFQADLAVTCTEPDPGRRWLHEPRLIVEVLSPSTVDHDLGRKLQDYIQLPSVQEVIMVWTDVRQVLHWRREGERWIVLDLIGDAVLAPLTVEGEIPLALLYQASGV